MTTKRADLLPIFEKFIPISEAAQDMFFSFLMETTAPKGTILLKPRQICTRLYFLKEGFAYQYRCTEKANIVTYFWFEQDFITNLPSFLTQIPSTETIEVLDDSILYSITYDQLQLLYQAYPEFNALGRLILEHYYLELANVGDLFSTYPAKSRYDKLLQQKPQLFQQATLGQIASYLNISQETLSRVRAQKEIS
ncbi:MAG: Crp/Fnr family transcriptional regulator [Bacteroidota bacterium]